MQSTSCRQSPWAWWVRPELARWWFRSFRAWWRSGGQADRKSLDRTRSDREYTWSLYAMRHSRASICQPKRSLDIRWPYRFWVFHENHSGLKKENQIKRIKKKILKDNLPVLGLHSSTIFSGAPFEYTSMQRPCDERHKTLMRKNDELNVNCLTIAISSGTSFACQRFGLRTIGHTCSNVPGLVLATGSSTNSHLVDSNIFMSSGSPVRAPS